MRTSLALYDGCGGDLLACSDQADPDGASEWPELDAELEWTTGSGQELWIAVQTGHATEDPRDGPFLLHLAFEAPEQGELANGDFADPGGFPWCFTGGGAGSSVSYADGAARVQGTQGWIAGSGVRARIHQEVSVAPGPATLAFSWEYESGGADDCVYYDVVDLATGLSLFGVLNVVDCTPSPGEWQTASFDLAGSGAYRVELGIQTLGTQAGGSVVRFDDVSLQN